jgi:hypothetical protein
LTYVTRNEPRLGERTNPNCNVETLFDQVKITFIVDPQNAFPNRVTDIQLLDPSRGRKWLS